MVKRISKRLLALLLATVMIVSVAPLSAIAEDSAVVGGTEGGSASTEESSVTNYPDFLSKLKQLELYAETYGAAVYRDPGELVLNFIRTGVERYQDDNWETLAGQEITGFTNYVAAQDAEVAAGSAGYENNVPDVMALRNIVTKDFKLDNGNPADFGHMFGCMNISYVNPGSADLSGWAGDLCDLLRYCVEEVTVPAGTLDEMATYIRENCFGVEAANAYGMDDFYGDMDAYYLISEFKKGEKSISELMEAYFTADLDNTDRTVYFMNNRFGVEDTKEAVRKAIYESYSSDVGIKILESKRGLSSYNTLREACCYAFADYVYEYAKGNLVASEKDDTSASNGYYSVFSSEHSILAPGIEQDIKYAQTVDGKQIVYYVATVDVNREDVLIKVNYRDNDPSKGWGLQTVADQVKALVKNYESKYEYFTPVVATNGDGYNIYNGTPGGLLIMDGKEWYGVGNDGFFAILDDGSAMIGTKADYATYKDRLKEAIGGFGAVLVKDGKINVTKNANYTASRASRTAVGITAEGKVVMMVMDGRQLPFSAGGAMEEIAQVMYEAGCVQAINLDGGGSTTYLSKPAGSDSIELTNRPSDGYQRMVATSLVAISTAKPSNEFDKAIISSDYDYITAGTSMQFSVTGVSNTGNAAVIPEGAYWRVSDETIATIDKTTGLFTAAYNEEEPVVGEVTVEFVVGNEVVGSKVIGVVIPDSVTFAEERIVAVYGVPKKLSLVLWYDGNQVAFNTETDVIIGFVNNTTFEMIDPPGIVDGLVFTPDAETSLRAALVVGVLAMNPEVGAYATLNLYHEDEATFDFENATQGNRSLAWLREIENARSTDNKLYRIIDPTKPIEIKYTFALDMTAIEMPAQLEPLKEMLPDGTNPESTAWSFLLSLAERVCVQTKVKIVAEFSPELDVDISELKVVTDYFELTSADLDENNVLTLVCTWKNQSQAIDPATANPLCILAGIKATVKDNAAYFNNEVVLSNNGNVSYDIYLATSALHSFASDPENQATYGLYPFEHSDANYPTGCRGEDHDTGGHFASQYLDFADVYVVNTEIRQGWQEEGTDYYYYVDNVPVTGTQLVPDRKDSTQMRFYEFGTDGKLVSEQGKSGLITFEGGLYYATNGVAQTGWQVIEESYYYFDPETARAVDGEVTIRERVYPGTSYTTMDEYTYTFKDHILTRGQFCYDEYAWSTSGWIYGDRYRWAGDWKKACWFEVDGDTYYVGKNEPYYIQKGYAHYIKNFPNEDDLRCFLFDENGVLQENFSGPADVMVADVAHTYFFKNGVRLDDKHSDFARDFHRGSDGYYYLVTEWDGTIFKADAGTTADRWVTTTVLPDSVKNYDGAFTIDDQGRVINNMADIYEQPNSVTSSEQGGVVTVKPDSQDTAPCRVGYFENGKYTTVTATKDDNGGYKFVVPPTVRVAIVVIGDVDGNGNVDDVTEHEVNTLVDIALGRTDVSSGSTSYPTAIDKAALAGDINGDGKVTAADIIQLIAMGLNKVDPNW